jgi:hypothetical protein
MRTEIIPIEGGLGLKIGCPAEMLDGMDDDALMSILHVRDNIYDIFTI